MSTADFLFTPTVQRVLAATLPRPEQTYTLDELLVLAAGGRGSVQKQIERLLAAGVLTEEPRRGRHRSIKANADYFLYPELSSIARKSFGLAEPLKEALRRFSPDIEEAFVFGSVAKGTDTQRSDVDLAVVGSAPLLELSEAVHKLEHELGRAIHLNLYAPDEWRELVERDPIVAQIAQGPKLRLLPDAKTT
jgi:predicted nucleotidyltransferase